MDNVPMWKNYMRPQDKTWVKMRKEFKWMCWTFIQIRQKTVWAGSGGGAVCKNWQKWSVGKTSTEYSTILKMIGLGDF